MTVRSPRHRWPVLLATEAALSMSLANSNILPCFPLSQTWQQLVEDAMTDLAQAESEDMYQAAYDEYLSEWSADQIKELGTHLEDFRTSICTAACDRSPFEPGAHPEPSSLLTR